MKQKSNPFEEKHIRKAFGRVFMNCTTKFLTKEYFDSKIKPDVKRYIDEKVFDDAMAAFKKDGYNSTKEDWDAFYEEWWEKGV